MANRIDRWRRTYDIYIPATANREKTGNTGLVRLFEIPGRDLAEEIQDDSNLVLGFFALYEDASVELIFQGIRSGDEKDDDKVVLVERSARTAHTGRAVPSASAVDADDFTTPRPPFDSDQGYGLI